MIIKKNMDEGRLLLSLIGRLDTTTASVLEKEIKQSLDGITELVLDFDQLEYVSSAGLRVLLGTQKTMNNQGRMIITNVNEMVMEVFEVTGLVDVLTIE